MKKKITGGSVEIEGQVLEAWGSQSDYLYFEILERIHNQMSAMLSHHSRVLAFRFDLRVSEFSISNKVASSFFKTLIRQLKRNYSMPRVGYIWAREQDTSDKQHYHCCLILDGNKVQYPDRIIRRMQNITRCLGLPCVYIPDHCYYMINRGDHESFSVAFSRFSYLSKVKTKTARQGAFNDYSSSSVMMSNRATFEKELAA